jgi:hypothetical protein
MGGMNRILQSIIPQQGGRETIPFFTQFIDYSTVIRSTNNDLTLKQ